MVDLNQFLTVGGLAAFLLLLTQALKTYVPTVDARYIPFATLGLGVVSGEIFAGTTGHLLAQQDWVSYGVGGLIAGFTAIGGYEATLDKILKGPPVNVSLTGTMGSGVTIVPVPDPVTKTAGGVNVFPKDTPTTTGQTPPLTIVPPPDQPPRG